jgi:quercetin dioxygenase-like cupin family protein
MAITSLTALVHEQLRIARDIPSGRSARTIIGGPGHALRQTVLALRTGHALSEHESPGEATLQVLHGHVVLSGGLDVQEGTAGDLLEIPMARHRLEARTDAVVLLTVARTE